MRSGAAKVERTSAMTIVHYRTAKVDSRKVFYREAGSAARRSYCCCTASRRPAICFAT